MTKVEELTDRVKKLEELVDKLVEVVNTNANKTLEIDSNLDLVVRRLKKGLRL